MADVVTPLVHPDEHAMIERASSGELDAFEQLYRRYARQVYGTCRRLLDTDQDAEEMTQRVFLKAWERLSSFEARSRLATWLRRIAVNLVIDQKRSLWREQLQASADESAPLRATSTQQAPLALDLERALRRLPDGARRVLVLHDVEGYTHAEVAGLLGVSVGTTKTQLFRARRAIREWLG